MGYIDIIKTAFIFFPVLAFIITLPFILRQYRKYGSIPVLRVIIVYSFTLYLLAAYFLIILPLPTITEVSNMNGPIANFIPFYFIYDFTKATGLFSREIYTVLFNIVLTIPFGIYLRYYFKQDLKHTILYTFMLSLFFEITQITGLYFIYPRPYRLFDVDDLMINTLGGTLGYSITKLFTFFLPTRDQLDEISYKNGTKVSMIRRLLAYMVDIILIGILTSIVHSILSIFNLDYFNVMSFLITLLIYYPVYMSIKKGQTPGKKLVKIRIEKITGEDAKWYNFFVRYFLLYGMTTFIPLLTIKILVELYKIIDSVVYLIILAAVAMMVAVIFIYIISNCFIKKKLFLYERMSKTKNASTIEYNEEKEKK